MTLNGDRLCGGIVLQVINREVYMFVMYEGGEAECSVL